MELSNLSQALLDLDEEEVLRLIDTKVNNNEDPLSVIDELRIGMEAVGDRYEKGEYFVSELVVAKEFFEKGIELLEPKIIRVGDDKATGTVVIGTAVIGTVAGDIHELGKNIVITILKINGFKIYDLGVDVSINAFIEEVKRLNPDIVGMSCLMTTSIESMKKTIEGLRKLEGSKRFKIMIGGGVVNEKVREYAKADFWGANAAEAVKISKTIMGSLREADDE
jgi:5-methyltetrahydrofolate--homocysteine methyltransferase